MSTPASVSMERQGQSGLTVLLGTSLFLTNSQAAIFIALLPRLQESLNLSPANLGSILAVQGLAAGIAGIVGGPLSDVLGRRQYLLWSWLLLSLSLVGHAVSHDFVSLLLVRALAGVATGLLRGRALVYLSEINPAAARRGRAHGRLLAGYALGHIVGVPVGLHLSEVTTAGSIFASLGLALLIVAFLGARCMTDPLGRRYLSASDWHLYLEASRDIWRHPRWTSLLAWSFAGAAAVAPVVAFFPLAATDRGLSTGAISLVFFLSGIAQVAALQWGGEIMDRRSPRLAIAASFALQAAASGLGFALLGHQVAPALAFCLVLAAQGLRMPSLHELAIEGGGPEARGQRSAIMTSFSEWGRAAGLGAAGWLWLTGGYALCIGFCGAVALGFLALSRR